mmetsp:Transcript_3416/g.6515  ORF Transcript_3416/g.6515 Transcript_3416/m.6515 type:complete len:203 (+) Transcript_3416:3458-4066(+)
MVPVTQPPSTYAMDKKVLAMRCVHRFLSTNRGDALGFSPSPLLPLNEECPLRPQHTALGTQHPQKITHPPPMCAPSPCAQPAAPSAQHPFERGTCKGLGEVSPVAQNSPDMSPCLQPTHRPIHPPSFSLGPLACLSSTRLETSGYVVAKTQYRLPRQSQSLWSAPYHHQTCTSGNGTGGFHLTSEKVLWSFNFHVAAIIPMN